MTRLRVSVIGGGANGEHEVSLASAAAVAAALDPSRYDVRRLTIDRDQTWFDGDRSVDLAEAVRLLQESDVALPVVHGAHGEDGTLAALLDLAGVPCAGSGLRAGAVSMDKWLTKLVARTVGIDVADGSLLTRGERGLLPWPGPCVVKPVGAGSSLGVTLVDDPARFAAALDLALAHDDRVLVEELVVGREIDVAVLRRSDGSLLTSPPLEITVDGLFDYETKYGGGAEFHVPASLDDSDLDELERAARTVFEAVGCAGVARMDFFLTQRGPVLIEVNTMPGMTEHSQVPRMFAAGGLAYPALLDELLDGALAR